MLKQKRIQNHLTLRQMAELVGLGYSYLSDIETGKKPAPNDKSVLLIADILKLNETEKVLFFDSAALSKSNDKDNFHVPVDICEYIVNDENIKSQIRNIKNRT